MTRQKIFSIDELRAVTDAGYKAQKNKDADWIKYILATNGDQYQWLVAATSRRLLRARCEPRNNGLIFKGKSGIIRCSYGNTESLAGLLKPGLRKSQ